MLSQGMLSELKAPRPGRGLSAAGRVTQWVLIMFACVPTEKEKGFDRVMGLPESAGVVALEQMSPNDRIELFLYEIRTERPARLGIITLLVRSKPSIVPVLVARLKTDDADQLYPLLLLANYAL